MINQASYVLNLTRDEFRELCKIKPWSGNYWDSPPTDEIKAIKAKISQQLIDNQEICSYCGLKLWGTSNGEVEHIAPKASFRNPEFTFTLKNLTLACHYCNGFSKKGTRPIILEGNRIYSKCTFNIVHPYFDNPEDHYEWTDNELQILIQSKNGSAKGQFSIELFELAAPLMNEFRAQQIRFEELKAQYPLSIQDEELVCETVDYKPY